MKDKLKRFLGLESWEEKIQRLPVQMDNEETEYIISTIVAFLDGTAGEYDWDDLMTAPKRSQEAEHISALCSSLDMIYPPREKGWFCGQEGLDKLKELVHLLKREDRTTQELLDFVDTERKKAEQLNGR